MVFIANVLWFISNVPKYLLFVLRYKKNKNLQYEKLKEYLNKNKNTEFGKKYNFSSIKSIEDFQEKVPISCYGDYEGYVEKIIDGQNNILTKDDVLLLEPTSGSASKAKLIPYTKSLKKEFQFGVGVWIVDLFINNPSLFFAKMYWLITPNSKKNNNDKIGFDDDSEYLGFFGKFLVNRILVVPNIVSEINDQKSFFHITLLFLLKNKDLGSISIWSPTIMDLFIKYYFENYKILIKDLKNGTINNNLNIDNSRRIVLEKKIGKNKNRAIEIERIMNNNKLDSKILINIWPKLIVISSWTEGASSGFLGAIKRYFPNVVIQGKGLISTECFVSFPLKKAVGCVLSINSHFFEFEDVLNGEIFLCGKLNIGRKYKIIVTTGGGLYRYNLNDIIEVEGFYGSVPLIKFIGKGDNFSDLYGEKLCENFLNEILRNIFKKMNIKPKFFMVAPEINKNNTRYVLFIEGEEDYDYLKIQEYFEKKMNTNFHYSVCRNLGQLKVARVFKINKNGKEFYINNCVKNGQKLGGVKNKILDHSLNWSKIFLGNYIEYDK